MSHLRLRPNLAKNQKSSLRAGYSFSSNAPGVKAARGRISGCAAFTGRQDLQGNLNDLMGGKPLYTSLNTVSRLPNTLPTIGCRVLSSFYRVFRRGLGDGIRYPAQPRGLDRPGLTDAIRLGLEHGLKHPTNSFAGNQKCFMPIGGC